MRRVWISVLLICSVSMPAFASEPETVSIPQGVEMIIWEHQNWETNGGYSRLTIWEDGRSEITVEVLGYPPDWQKTLRPRAGWERVRREHTRHVTFVRKGVYPHAVARKMFRRALEAGIHLLEPFKPGFVDGSGTRIVIQANGRQTETVIPMFLDQDRGTENHRRFLAVSNVLDGFDTNAYEVVGK